MDSVKSLKYISPITGKPCKSKPSKILRQSQKQFENPEFFRKKWRLWREQHPNFSSEYHKKHAEKNREQVTKNQRKYLDKLKARNAIKKVTPDNKCHKCGGINKLERHHPDYSKPLEIITLCRKCHIQVHYYEN